MTRGMPSRMVSMSSAVKPCCCRRASMPSIAAATRAAAACDFHQHIHEMEALAEPAFNNRRIPRIGIGAGKASAPFDDVDGSAEPRLGQKGGRDTALGRVRSLNAFSGGAGIVELCDAAGIAARQSGGFLDSPAGIAAAEDEPRRSRSRPEHVTGSGALEAAPEKGGLQREADPDDRLEIGRASGRERGERAV